jgi:hypothetical protein
MYSLIVSGASIVPKRECEHSTSSGSTSASCPNFDLRLAGARDFGDDERNEYAKRCSGNAIEQLRRDNHIRLASCREYGAPD